MGARAAIARLRGLEFRRIFSLRFSESFWGVARPMTKLERVLSTVAAVILGIAMWADISYMRSLYVDWTPVPLGAELASFSIWRMVWTQLSGRILGGLLWGLGGIIPVAIAIRAGWAWPERHPFPQHRTDAHNKPALELLPLSSRQVLTAKLQGRIGALAVSLVIGLGMLAVARSLMVAMGVVGQAPALLDPWLVGSAFIFYTLFVLSTGAAADSRRWGSLAASGVRFLAFALLAGTPIAVGHAAGLTSVGAWNFATYSGLVAVGATFATALPFLPGWTRVAHPTARALTGGGESLEGREMPTKKGLAAWLALAVEGAGSVAICGLGGDEGWSARRLKSILALALTLIVGVTLTSILWQTAAAAWYFFSHRAEQAGMSAGALQNMQDALGFGIAGTVFLFGMVIILLAFAAWPEIMSLSGAASQAGRPRVFFAERRHIGLLLPVRARHLWRQRLSSLLLVTIILIPAGGLSHLVSWQYGRILAGAELATVGPGTYWAFPAALLAALCCFASVSMVRPAVRTMPLSGCALYLLICVGIGAGSTGAAAIEHADVFFGVRDPVRFLLPLAVAWFLALLLASWAWSEPSTWKLSPDGSASVAGKLRASLVWLATGITSGCLFFVILRATFALG